MLKQPLLRLRCYRNAVCPIHMVALTEGMYCHQCKGGKKLRRAQRRKKLIDELRRNALAD